ncbi:MAG TPA: PQQ-binding-like beta-propeller repeat protein [Micromonosporaceae bacterium]|nr:PQQ-binding-like beta-propeller repeat protein [Micromonosporaceae bacterium]
MSGGSDSGSLIDLGVDFHPVGEREWTPSWQRLSWQRLLRRLRLAVPVFAVLLLVAASVAAPVDPLRLVLRVPVNLDPDVMIVGGDLYVYGIAGGTDIFSAEVGNANILRDYRLDGGGLRWSAPLPELPNESTISYLDGRVIVSMAATDATGEHTVALDARTGRRLWASDLGFAVGVADGVLVGSTPPPPGFNFVGTNPTTSFRLLDAATGQSRWSIGLDGDCLARPVSATDGPPDTLVALCASSTRLIEVDLASGAVVSTRTVDLGDPGRNFLLPAADQLPEPQLAVVGDTVLVAHAPGGSAPTSDGGGQTPTPTVDAYTLAGLVPRWSGVPVFAGQRLAGCGASLCILGTDGGGTLVDPRTGDPTGRVPPGTGPAEGALVLMPLDGGDTGPRAVPVVAVPAVAAGTSLALPSADPAAASVTHALLARWRAGGPPDRVTILSGVRVPSCLRTDGYLACATTNGQLALWQL